VRNRAARQIWNVVWLALFRPTPRPFHAWRRFLLRLFGARIGPAAHIYAGARIWAPWNLVAGRAAAIADGAEVYNPSRIELGDYSVISQGAYLCGATHDYESWQFPMISAPIFVGAHAWVAARAIVQMGVTIGEGCVIGAGSVVTRNMPAWTVCAGVPCQALRSYAKSRRSK
jgi:putative colanic acid biosynthesis acetyltransferase WcaF